MILTRRMIADTIDANRAIVDINLVRWSVFNIIYAYITAVQIDYTSRRGVYIFYGSRTVVYINLVRWSVFFIIFAYRTDVHIK